MRAPIAESRPPLPRPSFCLALLSPSVLPLRSTPPILQTQLDSTPMLPHRLPVRLRLLLLLRQRASSRVFEFFFSTARSRRASCVPVCKVKSRTPTRTLTRTRAVERAAAAALIPLSHIARGMTSLEMDRTCGLCALVEHDNLTCCTRAHLVAWPSYCSI